jgi:hypothetical protein
MISEGTGAAVVVLAGAGATEDVVDVGLGVVVVVDGAVVSAVVVVLLGVVVSATWCSWTAGRVGVWP